MFRTSKLPNPRSRRDVMPSGRRREHAQHVTSLKIYFRPRLTAVASRILKSLICCWCLASGGPVTLYTDRNLVELTSDFWQTLLGVLQPIRSRLNWPLNQIQRTRLTFIMITSAQAVQRSVTNNSSFQSYSHYTNCWRFSCSVITLTKLVTFLSAKGAFVNMHTCGLKVKRQRCMENQIAIVVRWDLAPLINYMT